jgi:uncharacterized protein (TIGR04255 family)
VTEDIQLSHPPLREAVILVQLSEELPPSFVETVRGQILAGYQIARPTKRGQFRFQIDVENPSRAEVTKEEIDGWRFDSNDGAKVLQVRRSGMTFSLLKGYGKWPDFKTSAREVWLQYCKWAGSLSVGRLVIRYINVIEIPLGVDFDDYLAAGPRIPPQIPQLLSGFFHRVSVPFAGADAVAFITQVLEPAGPMSVPVVLDIEVQSPWNPEKDASEIWSQFDKLREAANLIFFSSLTKKALEMYL